MFVKWARLGAALLLVLGAFYMLDHSVAIFRRVEWKKSNDDFFREFTFDNELTRYPRGDFNFRAEWYVSELPAKIRFRVDDCLTELRINGRSVSLPELLGQERLCLPDNFHLVDFTPYVHLGQNHLELTVKNDGDTVGVYTRGRAYELARWLAILILSSALVLIFIPLTKRFRWSHTEQVALVFLGFSFVSYTLFTSPFDRNYDFQAHLDLFRLILSQGSIPFTRQCYECAQQPTYYLVLAGLYSLAKNVFHSPITVLGFLQGVQLFFGWSFLWLIREIVREVKGRPSLIAFFFMGAWFTGFLHFGRISNDIPLYALSAFAVWKLIRWWKSSEENEFRWALLTVLVAMAIKVTALYLAATVLSLRLMQPWVFPRFKDLRWQRGVEVGLGALATWVLFRARGWYLGEAMFWVNRPYDTFKVSTDALSFLYFDFEKYFASSAANPYPEGKEYFWNYFLKSALHGEFALTQRFNVFLAYLQDFLIFPILALGAYLLIKRDLGRIKHACFPLLIMAFFALAMLLTYRYQYPYTCNQDFRFVYPLILLGSVYAFAEARWMRAMLWTFSIMSVLVIWSFVLSGQY